MIGKLICASMLVASSVPVIGQDVGRSPLSRGKADLAQIHRCTVVPGGDWQAAGAAGRRIDLEFNASAAPGAGAPSVSGLSINTKGTGANSGRIGSSPSLSASVDCVSGAASGDASQKSADMFLQMPPGWSCIANGSDASAQFVLTLNVPTSPGRSEWSFGTSSSSGHRVSIVPHGTKVAGASLVACPSKDGKLGYDLAVAKK